jgi:hypothetical protein
LTTSAYKNNLAEAVNILLSTWALASAIDGKLPSWALNLAFTIDKSLACWALSLTSSVDQQLTCEALNLA